MFDVLVYLYENYWRPDACPGHEQLTRKLTSVGFESEEIADALTWLDGVAAVAQAKVGEQQHESIRVYAPVEHEHLGEQSIGFIAFLESAGVLPPPMREMVIDRASAIPGGPLDLEDLKIIVLMVFWSLGEEPDALILDELFVDEEDRLIH
jgi:Smg protein